MSGTIIKDRPKRDVSSVSLHIFLQVGQETAKHAFYACHKPAAREYVGHTHTEKFPMLNLQCQTNFYEIIDVKNGLQFLRTNAPFIKAVNVTFEPYFSGTKTEFYLLIFQQITMLWRSWTGENYL